MEKVIKEEIEIKEECVDPEYDYKEEPLSTQIEVKPEFEPTAPDENLPSKKKKPRKGYQCKICLIKFARVENYRAHVNIHLNKYVYCDICKNKYAWKNSLRIHMYKHFDNQYQNTPRKKGKFPCSFCAKIYNYRKDMELHTVIHTNNKSFKCKKCKKTYFRKSSLQRHQRSHSNNMFFCVPCNKNFTRKYLFNAHKCRDEFFQCDFCNKILKSKNSVQRHIENWHLAVKNLLHYCYVCYKIFNPGATVRHRHEYSKNTTKRIYLSFEERERISKFNLFMFNDWKLIKTPLIVLENIENRLILGPPFSTSSVTSCMDAVYKNKIKRRLSEPTSPTPKVNSRKPKLEQLVNPSTYSPCDSGSLICHNNPLFTESPIDLPDIKSLLFS